MESNTLLSLLHLCDPALPIGSFSHSAGLETYVQQNIVNSKESAREFIIQQLSQNIFYTDAALASLIYDAACAGNLEKIIQLDELCNAVKLPMETRFASNKLGIRLLKIFEVNRDFILPNKYRNAINAKVACGHYCISFSLLAYAMKINKKEMLVAFYYNAATGFITNAVKLIPLGQQDGQEMLMSLFPLINELAQASLTPDENLIGYCCAGFDIRCMQHEQLYSRLYMS
ncbi:MAG: urease accessory protein UreF [Bacteroidota bacterium]|nr:urease accessory protein UreF [Bacteroidota bacterium]